jgi:hypothetical protein
VNIGRRKTDEASGCDDPINFLGKVRHETDPMQ